MTMGRWALGMEYVSTYGRVRWDVFGGGPSLVLVHGTPPDPESLAMATAISSVLLIIAFLYFKQVEATMADVL